MLKLLNKIHLTKLFEDTDINIPITIFSESQKKSNGYAYKQAWYHLIQEALGSALNNYEQAYHFQITSVKGKVYTLHCTGSNFMNELQTLFKCKAPLSIRIDILEDYDSTWIIIIKDDL